MTFFYDLNKKLAELANKQNLAEGKGAKPDFLDIDKDGNKKESFKQAVKDAEKKVDETSYSAKAARAGKDIGKPGKNFEKIAKSAAERYGSKERGEKVAGAVLAKLRAKESVEEADDHKEMKLIRDLRAKGHTDKEILRKIKELKHGTQKTNEADMEEGNEFSGALARAKTTGAKSFEVDGKEYPVKEDKKKNAFDPDTARAMFAPEKGKTKTGHEVKDTGYSKRYTKSLDADDKDEEEVSDQPKKKGRPKGKDKGPERVTKGAWKHKQGRKIKAEEGLDSDGVMMATPSNMSSEGVDHGEYNREGDMAKEQMHTIISAAKELHRILGDEENLPEWVQKKITLAQEYIDTARDYMLSQHAERAEEQPVTEKAVSQAQRRAAGIAYAAKKGEIPKKELRGASKEMAKMASGELKKFAKTKEKGLPEKVKEADAEDKPAKKGGFQFGKGVYESLDQQFKQALNEGMNINVSMGTSEHGEPSKNITISAEGEDADKLAELLKMAGIGSHGAKEETCSTCGESACSCESTMVDENSPDWPTDPETSDDALQYAGGLNKPKSTGQTTVPVIASQLRRQVSMEESVELERSLFKLYQNYKGQ